MNSSRIVRPMGIPVRWCFEYHGDTPMICRGNHEKWEECHWEEYEGHLVGMPAPDDPDSFGLMADLTMAEAPHSDMRHVYMRVFWAQDKDKPCREMKAQEPEQKDLFANFDLICGWRCPICRTLIFTASRKLLAQHNDECASRIAEKKLRAFLVEMGPIAGVLEVDDDENEQNYGSDGSGGW